MQRTEDAIEVRRGVVRGVTAPEQFLWKERLWLVHAVRGHWTEPDARREQSGPGAREVWIAMEHCTKKGQPKIVARCSYPLTAPQCVTMIFTDIAVIQVAAEGLVLLETAPAWTSEDVQRLTEAKLLSNRSVRTIDLSAAPAGRRGV